jgi:hypothetical protein
LHFRFIITSLANPHMFLCFQQLFLHRRRLDLLYMLDERCMMLALFSVNAEEKSARRRADDPAEPHGNSHGINGCHHVSGAAGDTVPA